MGQYSIRELEDLSGIKAHTIRIWEKRYGIVSPHRTPTNIRLYSDADLKKLINVALLNNHGLKISKIASLSSSELVNRVTELSRKDDGPAMHIDRLVVAMVDLDEHKFEATIAELIARFGFEKTILNITYPFLEKIGVLWQTGNISPLQEHFISNLLRQKILVAIDALPLPPRRSPRVVLFLPEGELHELGLLFIHYLVKKSGYRTYYLGQQVPLADVEWFCLHHTPVAMITSITTSPPAPFVEGFLNRLCSLDPSVTLVAMGHKLSQMALRRPKNLFIPSEIQQLKTLLRDLKNSRPVN
jgi:DNA-binding transcriptional MerR regulator